MGGAWVEAVIGVAYKLLESAHQVHLGRNHSFIFLMVDSYFWQFLVLSDREKYACILTTGV